MMEFFSNIGSWLVEYKDQILVFVTSSQFLTFAAMIASWFKERKANKVNSQNVANLTAAVTENNTLKSDIADVKTNGQTINDKLDTLTASEEKFDAKTEAALNLLISKFNAMLEVQSLVYSTIKDERIRNAVHSILTTAKYDENTTRIELQRQVEELRAMVAQKTEELNAYVGERVGEVVATVAGDNADDVIERY